MFLGRKRLNREGSRKGDLSRRLRYFGGRPRLRARRQFRHFSRQRRSVSSIRCIAAIDAPHDFPIAGQNAAAGARAKMFRSGSRPTSCSSLFPTSPAAQPARRRKPWPRGETRTAMPQRSTCWRHSKNSPDCGRIPRPSSKPSNPCSHGSTRSPHPTRRAPGGSSLTVDHVRYAIGGRERLGVASTFTGTELAARRQGQGLYPARA